MTSITNPPNMPELATIDAASSTFMVPKKEIHTGLDLQVFSRSLAYRDLSTWIMQLNRAMFPIKLAKQASSPLSHPDSEKHSISRCRMNDSLSAHLPLVIRLRQLLTDLEAIIGEAPPDQGLQRFGNIAFRKWSSLVDQRIDDLLRKCLPESLSDTALAEIRVYLLGSFGSAQRLDYGSGHELSFLAFLGCLWKLNLFAGLPSDDTRYHRERSIISGVFAPYLSLVRRLILTYRLEPAGSHGVWGLDDHSFLPYIFGSAQFGPAISPSETPPTEGSDSTAPDPDIVTKKTEIERYRETSMYFGAIGFIYDVKKGPFWEHSRVLYDISGVKAGWAKINQGMLKMYHAEVLMKFPVVQHFPFGTFFSWEPSSTSSSDELVVTPSNSAPQLPVTKPSISAGLQSMTNDTGQTEFVGTAAPWARAGSTMSNATLNSARSRLVDPMDMPSPQNNSMERNVQKQKKPMTSASWAQP